MWVVLSLLGLAVGATPGDRAVELATRLVDEVGPRPAYSPAAEEAQQWVTVELRQRGWDPMRVPGGVPAGTVLACREGESDNTLLLLAHTDSVHQRCPGAVDNAGSVATLLMAAEAVPDTTPRRICVAFPGGEELGLLGSDALATSGAVPGRLDLVVSLDLVGRGELTWNGLGPSWTRADLAAFLSASPAAVPWMYRAISHGLPQLERSDHRPFGLAGVRTAHLLTRGPHGVFWPYHTPLDQPRQLDPYTLQRSIRALTRLMAAEALGPVSHQGEAAAVVPWTRRVLPGWSLWLILALGAAAGVTGAWVGRPELGAWKAGAKNLALSFAGAAVAAAGAGLAMALAGLGRPLGGALTLPAVLAGWVAWTLVVVGSPWRSTPESGRMLAVVGTLLPAALLVYAGLPLLALPLGIGALFAGLSASTERWGWTWAFGTLWAPLFLIRANAVRELDFHGMLPADPRYWTAIWLVLAAPAAAMWLGVEPRGRREARFALAILLAVTLLWAWTTDPWASPFVEREILWAR